MFYSFEWYDRLDEVRHVTGSFFFRSAELRDMKLDEIIEQMFEPLAIQVWQIVGTHETLVRLTPLFKTKYSHGVHTIPGRIGFVRDIRQFIKSFFIILHIEYGDLRCKFNNLILENFLNLDSLVDHVKSILSNDFFRFCIQFYPKQHVDRETFAKVSHKCSLSSRDDAKIRNILLYKLSEDPEFDHVTVSVDNTKQIWSRRITAGDYIKKIKFY